MILLDTHVAIWLSTDNQKIGNAAYKKVQKALETNSVALSSGTVWDVGYLVKRGRYQLPNGMTVAQWWNGFLAKGVKEFATDSTILFRALDLDWEENDPVDRIIMATALHHDLELVTADRKMLEWKYPDLRIQNARD